MSTITQIRRLNYNGEDIGMGFNSDTGLGVGTALDFDAPGGAVSQEAQTDVSIVTSHEQLMRTLNMSADLEGRYAFASIGAKASFANSTQYNSASTFVVARMTITNTVSRGHNFRLKPALQHLLDTNQKDVFDRAFGDSFIRAHYEGGEFYAVMRITSIDSKTESQLAVDLHASLDGGFASVDFKGNLARAQSDEKTRSEFSVKYYQKGGMGAEEIGTTLDLDEIKQRLKQFPNAVQLHPFPYFIEVATYDTVPLPLPTKEQQEAFLLALKDANERKLRYLEAQNDCEFAAEHPEYFFKPPSRPVLLDMASAYLKLVNAVLDHSVRLSKGQIDPPQLFDPASLTPPLSEPEIVLRKRDVGLEASFADFWTTKDKPATLHNDRDLVTDIGLLAMGELNDFNAILDPSGDETKTLRLQGEALSRVVSSFQEYDWDHSGMHSSTRQQVESLTKLPIMLPKTCKKLAFSGNLIENTQGLEQFTTLVELDLSHNRLSDVSELGTLSTLRKLSVVDNVLSDISALGSCAALETLDISGNDVTSLAPLSGCTALKNLTISGTMLFDGAGAHRWSNPISDARALADIAALKSPFTVGNTLQIRVGILKDGEAAQFRGTADRIGDSLSFKVHLNRGEEIREEIWDVSAILALSVDSWPPEILAGMIGGASVSDLPCEGSQTNVFLQNPGSRQLIGFCYADPRNPIDSTVSLHEFPVFGTKFPIETIDAVVFH